MKILVTGSAGFIGFHISQRLLNAGYQVVGIDNLNDYYDVNLKKDRLNQISHYPNFKFIQTDLTNYKCLNDIFFEYGFKRVIHLAGQGGVRYSMNNPNIFIKDNIVAYTNILEVCRHYNIEHLLYASSSSVYGLNRKTPFSINDSVDHPISLYAATKKSNELMAHTYSYLYGIPTTGLRFFTVYGPWSRPDMALFTFTKAILKGESINVYNFGKMKRDFIYINDVSDIIFQLQSIIPQHNQNLTFNTDFNCYKIYNIGTSCSISILLCINLLEEALGIKAKMNMSPLQSCDVIETSADIKSLCDTINFVPQTNIKIGIQEFVNWYHMYHAQ